MKLDNPVPPKIYSNNAQTLFNVDRAISKLVHRIELLNYINPINIELEKRYFFASKYNLEPSFRYPKLDFDTHALQKKLFAQPIETIKDATSAAFFKDVIYAYSDLIQCISSIGQGRKFYYSALKAFGTPSEKDVQNAKFILHFQQQDNSEKDQETYSAQEAVSFFEEFTKQFGFDLQVKLSTKIAAEAMVQNNTRKLILKKNYRFTKHQLAVLANHEVGVHLVTTFNAIHQPLTVFSSGFPKNVETQEGLAVFSEYMSGNLTLKRLKELAYRVLATDSLRRGFSFCDTFDLLHNQYKLPREDAFSISLRAHRGGGFTKDHLYLTGLKKIYKYYKAKQDITPLLLGKVALQDVAIISHWKSLGIVMPPNYENAVFLDNKNTNGTLDFILEHLK